LEAICNILSLNVEYSSFLFGSVLGKNFHVVLNSLLSSNCSVRFKVFVLINHSDYIEISPGTIILKQQSCMCTAFRCALLTKVWHLQQNGADGKRSDVTIDFRLINRGCTIHLIGLHLRLFSGNVP